jgi:hypothetical protein
VSGTASDERGSSIVGASWMKFAVTSQFLMMQQLFGHAGEKNILKEILQLCAMAKYKGWLHGYSL